MPDYNVKSIHVKKSTKDLEQQGKDIRKKVTFEELGTFKPVDRDPMKLIDYSESKLDPALLPMRQEKMEHDIFSFYRGSVELMDYDLSQQTSTDIHVVVDGDAHIANFGFYASPERQLVFDLNDFDESDIGDWSWDLKRLLVSVILASGSYKVKEKDLKNLIKSVSESYRTGIDQTTKMGTLNCYYYQTNLDTLKDVLGNGDEKNSFIEVIEKKAPKRNSEQVVKKYTETDPDTGELRFKDEPPVTQHLSKKEFDTFLPYFKNYLATVLADVDLMLSQYTITDIVHHSVGVGSFGTLSYLVLLTSNDGTHLVLQIKQALPSKVSEYRSLNLKTGKFMPSKLANSNGERIIDCQQILQCSSDTFLGYFQTVKYDFYVRQFRDMKESVTPKDLDWSQYVDYCEVCSWILALAHAQSPTSAVIHGYLGHHSEFDDAMVNWAFAYQKQVEKDYQTFCAAIQNTTKRDK